MKPGPELDALVEEKVMGKALSYPKHLWELKENGERDDLAWNGQPTYHTGPLCTRCGEGFCARCDEVPEGPCTPKVPPYSTDIAAAFQVKDRVRSLLAENGEPHYLSLNEGRDWWEAWFHVEGCPRSGVYGDTAPHAICLAALRAVGAGVPI